MAQLLSHSSAQEMPNLEATVSKIEKRLVAEGDTKLASVSEKLNILGELKKFSLGQFLIMNQGMDGVWNHYIAYEYPRLNKNQKPQNPMEKMLIEIIATDLQVRLELVKKIMQGELREGISLLSIPCGIMAELSTLDFSGISNFNLFGVDLDSEVLVKAGEFSQKMGLKAHTQFACKDAWHLDLDNQFDILVSLGLNIFVKEKERLLDLYRSFHKALKPGGKLLASFPTPDSFYQPDSERRYESLDPNAVRLRRIVFNEIVKIGFGKAYSSLETIEQFKTAGFAKVEIEYTPNRSPNIAIATK